MPSPHRLFATFAALCAMAGAAFAGDPVGNWKWTEKDPGGKTSRDVILTLSLTDGKLSGLIFASGPGRAGFSTDIIGPLFKDEVVSFSVERDVNASKVITRYRGKLTGDFINGTAESLGRDGLGVSRPWTAARSK